MVVKQNETLLRCFQHSFFWFMTICEEDILGAIGSYVMDVKFSKTNLNGFLVVGL